MTYLARVALKAFFLSTTSSTALFTSSIVKRDLSVFLSLSIGLLHSGIFTLIFNDKSNNVISKLSDVTS